MFVYDFNEPADGGRELLGGKGVGLAEMTQLAQTTLGMSRDDADGKFLTGYLEDGVIEHNPFETLNQDGVGALMEIGVERGRATKPEIKVGGVGINPFPLTPRG